MIKKCQVTLLSQPSSYTFHLEDSTNYLWIEYKLMIAQISIPSDWQLLLIILPFVAVVIVIILGEVLFRRRKKRLRQNK